MTDLNDARPFPIQGELRSETEDGKGRNRSAIPWWLAEIAYREYAKMYGEQQSLERLAERGGFGRRELLTLLAKAFGAMSGATALGRYRSAR